MKLRITVEGQAYEVDVEVLDEAGPAQPSATSPAPAPIPAAPPQPVQSTATPTVRASDAKACVSPLSGTVLKVLVSPGDAVTVNQTVVVLDAMKMETSIPAPVEGRIKAVHAKVGANVKQGDLLVEFE